MLPQPMSWSEPLEDDSDPLAQPDLVDVLQRQVSAGFPPGLALDLVLNELVVRAATATRAQSAALALQRDNEMVCRAATGQNAPDLGIPLNTKDGLSGACLRTHQSQLCLDTGTDNRVDAVACSRLGIRSMLVVPVLERDEMVGVLEVFGTDPAEFVESDQNLLEIFAREAARIRRASLDLENRVAPLTGVPDFPSIAQPENLTTKLHGPYEIWTLVLNGLAIFLAVAISFVIGSRMGWTGSRVRMQPPPQVNAPKAASDITVEANGLKGSTSPDVKPAHVSNPQGLVVSEKGKIVFRMEPSARKTSPRSLIHGTTITPGEISRVWLSPGLAETRLRQRQEPQYPSESLAAHHAGDVLLEVVVGVDGSVASTRVVSGDPLLAAAAADAVRSWRYEPYRLQGRPAEFQTDVTLKFVLPE